MTYRKQSKCNALTVAMDYVGTLTDESLFGEPGCGYSLRRVISDRIPELTVMEVREVAAKALRLERGRRYRTDCKP